MRVLRILGAGAGAAAVVAATLLVYLENFGRHEAAPAPLSRHGSALQQRLADEGGDQGGGGTEDPTLQPSEQQEEQQEEQQQQQGGDPHHGNVRLQ